jgi:O-acetyl-ADP-ribose deacetylase (regulator of RNase III)
MQSEVKVGDVLDEPADVLISTANPWLNVSGGVNGAILLRGGEAVQAELRDHLRQRAQPHVPPGSVVRTGPGPLSVKHILHAVAIDAFYDSSVELVESTLVEALDQARHLGASTIAMPALATGYGPLKMEEFAEALRRALRRNWSPLARLTVVLRREESAHTVTRAVQSPSGTDDEGG